MLAIEKFDQALQLDPQFDEALAEKAGTEFLVGNVGYEGYEKTYTQAESTALKALEINKNNAMAYAVLGAIYKDQLKWRESIEMHEKALALQPNNALINYWFSLVLRNIADFERAIFFGEKASQLDPLYPVIHMGHVVTLTHAKEYEMADEVLKNAEPLFGNSFLYYWAKAQRFLSEAQYEAANKAYDQALKINPRLNILLASKAIGLGKLGRVEEVMEIVSSFAQDDPRYFANMSNVHLGLGNVDSTLHYLELSVQRKIYKPLMKTASWYDPIRDHPRFQILLGKMGLKDPL